MEIPGEVPGTASSGRNGAVSPLGEIMKVALLMLLLFLSTAVAVEAQTVMGKDPVSKMLRQRVQREAKNIIAAAEEMPENKYSYRPTPDQVTFAHLIIHIVTGNELFCSKISGVAAPPDRKLIDTMPKEVVITALNSSFDYCTRVLAHIDDSRLGEGISLFGGTWSRAAIMFQLSNAFADHYCEASMYLRLNGLLPPTAQPAK